MIETERLLIKPLSYDQLLKYIQNDNGLEQDLQLNKTSREISADLKEALEQTILPNVADPRKNYLFSTLWTVILKSENRMVADFCFVGEPNAAGEIEIGYGTYTAFRGRGIMTEVVREMIRWAVKQSQVKAIVATTEQINIASFSILQKNNFVKVDTSETMFMWRLEIR